MSEGGDKVPCTHKELDIIDEWSGPDATGSWSIGGKCADCGRASFLIKELLNNYKMVKK